MNCFSLGTATEEKDYFFVTSSDSNPSVFTPGVDPVLKMREQVWRSSGTYSLSFALVSHSELVTFSAGPLMSGRKDRIGRPIVNYVIIQSSEPDEKRQLGEIFSSMLVSESARTEFAEKLESEMIQPVLRNEEAQNRLFPAIKAKPFSANPVVATQQLYPVTDALAAKECAGKIPELIEKKQDFAVGLSACSGNTVAQKLQEVYAFDWPNTFIAVFSTMAEIAEPLSCPALRRTKTPSKTGKGLRISIIISTIIVLTALLLLGGLYKKGPKSILSPEPIPQEERQQTNIGDTYEHRLGK
jgi:hypothetical protein